MNNETSWTKSLKKWFPYLLLVIAGFGVVLTLVIHRTDLTVISLVIVVPMILAALILLFSRNTNIDKLVLPKYSGKINFTNQFLINTVILIITTILLVYDATRPLLYFGLISLYAGGILLQILTERLDWTDNLILSEIILLSLSLTWGVTLKYPLYFGDTDLLGHFYLINTIVTTGSTSMMSIDYIHYPLYHIFNAAGIEITVLSIRTAVFVMMAVAWQFGILFSFLLFKRLSGSAKFGLIGCLFFTSSSLIVQYTAYAIPRALALIFMMCWVYLVLSKASKDARYLFLSLIAMSAMVFTHHVNVLFVIPILILLYFVQMIIFKRSQPDKLINPLFICLFGIFAISYFVWASSSYSNSTLSESIRRLIQTDYNLEQNVTGGYGYSVLWGVIYYSFVLLLSILGLTIVLSHLKFTGRLLRAVIFALTGFVLLIIYIPGPLNLLKISSILPLDRLQFMASPFVLFLVVYGIYYIFQNDDVVVSTLTRRLLSNVIPVLFLIAMVFWGITGNGLAQDNDYLPDTRTIDTPYFTNSELLSFAFLDSNSNGALPLYADYQTVRNDFLLTNFPGKEVLQGGDISYIQQGYLLLRIGELQRKKALTFLATGWSDSSYRYSIDPLNPSSDILINLEPITRIYDNSYVQVFVIH